jgi:Phage integrase, N-terminal SAM-like domain
VTHLRQIMLEELERRNYAPATIRCYIHTVEHFSRYFHCSPDQLGPDIRQYQAALFTRWKLTPNTVTQRLAARLRTFPSVSANGNPESSPHGHPDPTIVTPPS